MDSVADAVTVVVETGAVVVLVVVAVVVQVAPPATLFKVEAGVVTNATAAGCIVGFVDVAAVDVTAEAPVVVDEWAVVVDVVIRLAVDENKTSGFVTGSCCGCDDFLAANQV